MARSSQDVPALVVDALVALDELAWRLNRQMHGLEREVGEERPRLGNRCPVGVDELDESIHQMLGRVEVLRQIGGLAVGEPRRLAVDGQVGLLLEVVGAGGIECERSVEAPGAGQGGRRVTEVPLAAQVGAVAGIAQAAGDGDHVGAQLAFVAGSPAVTKRGRAVEACHAGEVGVDPGQQHGARRRAHRRDVEVAEHHPARGDRIDVRRADLAAVRAQVRESDIVRDDHDNVRT